MSRRLVSFVLLVTVFSCCWLMAQPDDTAAAGLLTLVCGTTKREFKVNSRFLPSVV
jgi:hypothetical protein